MEKLTKTLKAVANERRLAILKYLKKNQRASVDEIAKNLKFSFAAASKHLLILWRADILQREQKSFYGVYSLKGEQAPIIKDLLSKL
ncbi:hypothetical protein A3A09_03725 [Candidatus Nomurabacteria bacterium RIFCSPLOWO2_01_FULL_42_20]|uniref:HTH arsR-type domain-containing protein n=1 Tax=Candidatus Nomurabacteria bacterium RIFCSPHIGHO2_01_FULL_42_16 TaxID=1801743 RepID=A0A1F6VI58_9BACT|nr:MAG: hypothetical protein A2824_00890 [Candidatus Nomurabacteria bacterium RIFCSPHIGHO2_01_FULL_42_16]OGI91416.1 MAG: hypothetical protein A3A09_03725 [Candidatus Nomurabacteria bacterium RIFCSPLOWO2_01_FULL_42_20]